MFKNYWKPCSKYVLKISTSLKAILGTIATSAYVMDNKSLAFWLLVSGAILDELIKLLPSDTGNDNTPGYMERVKMILILIGFGMLFAGCGTVKRTVNKNSTQTQTSETLHLDSLAVRRITHTAIVKTDSSANRLTDTSKIIITERVIDTNVHIAADTSTMQFDAGNDTTRFSTPGNEVLITKDGAGIFTLQLINKQRDLNVQLHEKQTSISNYKHEEQKQASAVDSSAASTADSGHIKKDLHQEAKTNTKTKLVQTTRPPVWYVVAACFLPVIAILIMAWYLYKRFYKPIKKAVDG